MMRILDILVPIFIWAGTVLIMTKTHVRGASLFYLITVVNLLTIVHLTLATFPNYIWVLLFSSVVIAIILVIWLIMRDYDLVLRRYNRMLSRILALATTFWWFFALILTFLG